MSGAKSPSPRSSPLLQFFSSSSSPGTGGGATSPSSGGGATSPRASPSSCAGDDSASNASSIIRSLSKCFDGGVSMEEAVLNEEAKGASAKAGVLEGSEGNAGAQKWGPSHSVCSDDQSAKQNKTSGGGGGGLTFGTLFKPTPPSPSKGSHGNSSGGKTDPTAPVTTSTGAEAGDQSQQQIAMNTGMAAPTTPGASSALNSSAATSTSNVNTTAAAMGSSTGEGVASFWNAHARPATACEGNDSSSQIRPSTATAAASTPSSLSTSARAAADAVMGMLSRAEELIVSTTAGSAVAGREGGFCSPKSSPRNNDLALEGIPEETTAPPKGNCDNVCGGFEFEQFGFNAFQGDNKDNNNGQRCHVEFVEVEGCGEGLPIDAAGFPSQHARAPSPEPEQPKGYEIRLKSSFSMAQAKRERKKDQGRRSPTAMGAFGRTHPNNQQEKAYQTLQQQSQRHINDARNDGREKGSRALPDGLPFQELSVPTEIERSVSELTMRSHGAVDRHASSSDSRRMAYYAVGRTAPNSSTDDGRRLPGGGNRRCYFTGAPIPYGAPFYAGSVRQGPRTLVVFCLPSALGLPKKGVTSLPDPDDKLLKEMGKRYPGPFDTLPAQVRSAHCWRLFVKFCFFSGLPIAEGEMHFRVKDNVRAFPPSSQGGPKHQDEEIALSHEVMEAVNGEVSAEILRLPNQTLFDYLRRQYSQQSSKLRDEVFVRSSWEMVRPEV